MTLRDKIEARLAAIKRGPTVAERAGGLSKMYISDILKGKKRSITLDNWPKLALALDMSDDQLAEYLGDVLSAPKTSRPKILSNSGGDAAPAAILPIDATSLPRNIPVRGTAAGSVVGAFIIDGTIDQVRRPPGLTHATNAYALYVTGTSMSPKFEPGDLVYVNPDRPAATGDTVIITTQNYDGAPFQAWIKILLFQSDDAIVASQLNPSSKVEYSRSTVVSVHRVMKLNELFGV